MKNFKDYSRAVQDINSKLESCGFYEFYVARISSSSVTLQGKYSSDVARNLQKFYATTTEVCDRGYVRLSFDLYGAPIEVVLT